MELLVPIALYGWLPVVMVLLHDIRGHRGLTVAFVTSWLFLPATAIAFSGLPDYTKVTATTLGSLLAVLMTDFYGVLTFRPRWPDLFMVCYCVSPLASAMSNSLGMWDGFSKILTAALIWGIPYFLGRMYFDSFDKLKTLAYGILIGGLVYVPLCLFEIRMSPQLHHWVYGPRIRSDNLLLIAMRFGTWRPMVFMYTGLELGMWMTAASLMGFALWYSGTVRRIGNYRISGPLLVLLATTILCKSTGALLLLFVGMALLVAARSFRSPLPLLCLLMVPLIYLPTRTLNWNDGSTVVDLAAALVSPDRAQSLEFRFQNETMLVNRALEAPWFGWGGWGRELVYDEYGKTQSIVDGLWIQTLGQYGLVGLLSLYGAFLIAPALAICRFSGRDWRFVDTSATLALATFTLLYMIDCLLNAMINPIYALISGGITTVVCLPSRQLLGDVDTSEADQAIGPTGRGQLWPRPLPSREYGEPVART